MPELSVDDVVAYTNGRLEDNDETARMLVAALAAARRYCGWHVTPVRDDVLTVDGPGRSVLSLPSLQLLEITALVEDGDTLDVLDLRWSRPKGQVYKDNGCWWTGDWNAIEVSMTHGFETAPDFNEAVLSLLDRTARGGSTGAIREVDVAGVYQRQVSYESSGSASAFSPAERLKSRRLPDSAGALMLVAAVSISHEVYVPETTVDGYPVEATYEAAETRTVYGWQPEALGVDNLSDDEHSMRVTDRIEILVPDITPYSALDRITLGGQVYRVDQIRDYDPGPFGYQPGGVVVVERVSG